MSKTDTTTTKSHNDTSNDGLSVDRAFYIRSDKTQGYITVWVVPKPGTDKLDVKTDVTVID